MRQTCHFNLAYPLSENVLTEHVEFRIMTFH